MLWILGSEGKGYWGKEFVTRFLLFYDPDARFEYRNCSECHLIIRSNFLHLEPAWNTIPKPYIYWSGETYFPWPPSPYQTKALYLLTTLISQSTMNHFLNSTNYLYIPYCLYSRLIYQPRLQPADSINDKYFLAYCNSHKVSEREQLFSLFVKAKGSEQCHSYGSCYGDFPETQRSFPESCRSYNRDHVVLVYTHYRFVLAMENQCVPGYITEKIVSVFRSGAIPIYWGSSNCCELFNPKAFINVNNFDTFQECVAYVTNLSEESQLQMLREPIYRGEMGHLFDSEYNRTHSNSTLTHYQELFKNFISK